MEIKLDEGMDAKRWNLLGGPMSMHSASTWRSASSSQLSRTGRPRSTDKNLRHALAACTELQRSGRVEVWPNRRLRGVDVLYSMCRGGSETGLPKLAKDIMYQRGHTAPAPVGEERRGSLGGERRGSNPWNEEGLTGYWDEDRRHSHVWDKHDGGHSEAFFANISQNTTPRMQPTATTASHTETGHRKRRRSLRPAVLPNIDADPVARREAKERLEKMAVLRDMEVDAPGMIAKLAGKVRLVHECEGQVLMRQGAKANMCFIVMKGTLGVYIAPPESVPQNIAAEDVSKLRTLTEVLTKGMHYERDAARRPSVEVPVPPAPVEPQPEMARRGSVRRASREKDKPVIVEEVVRYRTTDGCSYFTEAADLGERVAYLEENCIGGEMALLQNSLRLASIRCETDCELYLVRAEEFHTSGMRKALEKVRTFDAYLPEALEAYRGESRHPASYMKLQSFPKGHAFLTEGLLSEACVFMIQKGEVEFQQCGDVRDDPVSKFAVSSVCAAIEWGDSPHEVVVVDKMSEGGLFCSLTLFPIQGYEPFTARVVSDKCDVLLARSTRIRNMPQTLVQVFRRRLLESTLARLRLSSVARLDGLRL